MVRTSEHAPANDDLSRMCPPGSRGRDYPCRHGAPPMPGPSTTAHTDRGTFFEAVRAAGILTSAQLHRAHSLAPSGSAADAARRLVAAGLLTRFQADRLLAGRVDGFFLGRYAVLEQVGRGPMGCVYKAKHRTMNRPVAIKVLAAELTRTAEERQRFHAGARAAAQLAHPNIVTVYDANERHDRFYLVLEYVDGPNLERLVGECGPLPVAQACEFVRQIAAGLQHTHEKGMIHRDIKPTNLLVARPNPVAPLAVKIADFGIPKDFRAGDTPYVAPEARSMGTVDGQADLYSLGAVFYFLLTARPPDPIPLPLAQLRPDLAPEVARVVYRLLDPEPNTRFRSAEELLVELDSACVPEAIPVDTVTFELPGPAAYPAYDHGYLSGRHAEPHSGPFPAPPLPEPLPEMAPWAYLTTEVTGETIPLNRDATPPPLRVKAEPTDSLEPGAWRTFALFVGTALLCLMGIGSVLKALMK